jgi:hypothetical protein
MIPVTFLCALALAKLFLTGTLLTKKVEHCGHVNKDLEAYKYHDGSYSRLSKENVSITAYNRKVAFGLYCQPRDWTMPFCW